MTAHLRGNLVLFALTVLVCCVLYPLLIWGIGRTVFPHKAEGSLLTTPDGKTVGSRLIAQPFSGDEYFQPRPSAASYNAAASGASNWGASNPKLRDRVARTLGPIARYASGPRKGELVGPDIEQWVREHPELTKDKPRTEGSELHAAFFDLWLQAHPGVELEKVPADLVMASGSGLDPHITRRNAVYQARRVAEARAKKAVEALEKKEGKPLPPARKAEVEEQTRRRVEQLVEQRAFRPMGALTIAGSEELVNVLELNLVLDKQP